MSCRFVLALLIYLLRWIVTFLQREQLQYGWVKTITDSDYADDIALLTNTPNQAETLQHSLEQATAGIGLHVNAHKTEYMCYNQTGDISTLDGTFLKLVDKFTYQGSSVSSTEKDIDTRLTKAWTGIDRLSIIWKSDLTDKMKRSFFQAAVVSILLYGFTTWRLTKGLKKTLDGNYTRMLRAIFSKSWRQHPQGTNYMADCLPSRKLYKLDEPDTQDTAGEARTNASVMYSYGPLHMAKQKQDDQLEHTYSIYVRIRDVALKTGQKRWMIGRSGERGSGISVLAARYDDDDDCLLDTSCFTYAEDNFIRVTSLRDRRLTIPNINAQLNRC